METYYSIISINVNPTLQERIGVGMLLVSGEQYYFRIAEDKLSALKDIMANSDNIAFAKSYLRNMRKELDAYRSKADSNLIALAPQWSSFKYVDYLSRYANNLVQFSEAKALDLAISPEVFDRLFAKWIYAPGSVPPIVSKLSAQKIVAADLYPRIDNRVNLDVTLTHETFSDLFLPVEVNFIGKNGHAVIGKAVDFDKRNYNLAFDLTRFGTLIKAVESAEKKAGTYFIMGAEPKKTHVRQHRLWSQVQESDMFQFVDLDELEVIEEFVKNNEVAPYFSEAV